MKFVLAIVLVFALCANAQLPSDLENPSDLAKILSSEPAAASHRFAEVHASNDVITFREDGSPAAGSSSSSVSEGSEEETEFDAQIAQVEDDVKKVKDQIKESEECARRLADQKVELRNLNEQLEHLNKEKQKHILQGKLDKQMRDLAEINRMSRALRLKFADLKRTQQLIKTKLTGTKTSLNQLDGNADLTVDDVNESTKDIVSEVDHMHKAQSDLLARAQGINSKEVKKEMTHANNVNIQGRAKQDSSDDDI